MRCCGHPRAYRATGLSRLVPDTTRGKGTWWGRSVQGGPQDRSHRPVPFGAGVRCWHRGDGTVRASSAVRQPSCTRVATKGLVYLFFFPPPRLVFPAGGGGVRQAGSWRVLSLLSDLLRRPPPAVTSARVWDRATATSPEVWPLGLGAVCPGEPHQHLNACLGSRAAPKCHRQSPGRCDGDARGDVANVAGQLPALLLMGSPILRRSPCCHPLFCASLCQLRIWPLDRPWLFGASEVRLLQGEPCLQSLASRCWLLTGGHLCFSSWAGSQGQALSPEQWGRGLSRELRQAPALGFWGRGYLWGRGYPWADTAVTGSPLCPVWVFSGLTERWRCPNDISAL